MCCLNFVRIDGFDGAKNDVHYNKLSEDTEGTISISIQRKQITAKKEKAHKYLKTQIKCRYVNETSDLPLKYYKD